jgi:hypothetical protein
MPVGSLHRLTTRTLLLEWLLHLPAMPMLNHSILLHVVHCKFATQATYQRTLTASWSAASTTYTMACTPLQYLSHKLRKRGCKHTGQRQSKHQGRISTGGRTIQASTGYANNLHARSCEPVRACTVTLCPLPHGRPEVQLVAYLPSQVPHLYCDTTFGNLAHVEANLDQCGAAGQAHGDCWVLLKKPHEHSSRSIQLLVGTAQVFGPSLGPLTVGIMSSWNDPVVSTLTSELLPAFCNPIKESSISRLKNRLREHQTTTLPIHRYIVAHTEQLYPSRLQ